MVRRVSRVSIGGWRIRVVLLNEYGEDEHAAYPPAIAQLKAEGALEEYCRHLCEK